MRPSVLVIDDDQTTCEILEEALRQHVVSVQWTTDGSQGLAQVTDGHFDTVITDMRLGSVSGLDVCRQIAADRPDIPVIVMTAFGDMRAAVDAMRAGAHDFLTKPFQVEALAHRVHQATEQRRLRDTVQRLDREVLQARGPNGMIGRSPVMNQTYELAKCLASGSSTLLLTGESGTGKEEVARAIHDESPRRDQPFVAVNCAAMPAELLESELFGHVKGAFTDAHHHRTGLFLQAGDGTLLLDEIGELPIPLQSKLLRVLQERKVRPIGGDREVAFGARVLAATNRNLEVEVEAGRFREDLYYRINVVQIDVPPLRSRGEDVLLLAQHFVNRFAARRGKGVVGLTSEAAARLLAHDWPGNVRQLENAIERAVTLTPFDRITVNDLPERIALDSKPPLPLVETDDGRPLRLDELEQHYIEQVFRVSNGNKSHAARILGLDRKTLYRKLNKYELDARSTSTDPEPEPA